ncbi:MAG: sulfite exporter TauE/SafE family protein [Eubacteriales bacterium]
MNNPQKNIVRITLRIDGMTCPNCEARIQRMLDSTEGVLSAKVSYRTGEAELSFDEEILTLKEIRKKIGELGYRVIPDGQKNRYRFLSTLIKVAVILVLFALLQYFGLLNYLVPSALAEDGMGYGMLFVIGLITSVHCIAMCGGINLSQSLPSPSQKNRTINKKQAMLPTLLYNLGRVISYTATGFILGLVGMAIGATGGGISYLFQGILKIIAGVFMVIMGVNMLGIFPGLRKISLHLPASLTKKLHPSGKTSKAPLVVGLLNGLMPCGPLQSMQILALASGNPITGALSMLAFSLGTVPLMLGLGSLVSLLGRKFAAQVTTVGSLLVVVLGLSMLSQGGSLSGLFTPDLLFILAVMLAVVGLISCVPFRKPPAKYLTMVAVVLCTVAVLTVQGLCCPGSSNSGNSTENEPSQVSDDVQTVHSTLLPGEYPNIEVKVGVPVVWTIDAPEDSINGCNYKILIEEYGIEYTFHEGENIIEFTPERTGSFFYCCWMGMIYGNITVTE